MAGVIVSPQGHKQNLHTSARKSSSGGSQKDLWLVVRDGSLADVDYALALLKKNGNNINLRNIFGLTPLHIATWRNHIPIVRRLLAAGADPDARDGESGWSSLHRAMHFGHLAVASVLLQFGASITLEDSKSRTPLDLLSGPVVQVLGDANNSATDVYSWGSGTNYQLGTGNTHIQKLPCKVDSLHGSFIKLVSASKFHSVAVSARGEVFTWGFGRGGRLGHPEFDIHSGQAAVITPLRVTTGLGSRPVRVIAAAKHHTVIATEAGEVFTWGSNREGQLGYTSVDTQPTPRRVSALRAKIVSVAAANKHTAVVSESGEVFTWGSNREGQLGYGTSNSASNYIPRVVEYLKGKVLTGVAAAKYHTIVVGVDGEVFTWGHRLVTPRRVIFARNIKKSGNTPLKFHRMKRLHVVAIGAGMVYSTALTDDGTLFYWLSNDPDLKCQQLYSLSGKNVVNISAGKYWTAVVTSTGDVYMWDGKSSVDRPPFLTRLHGVKKATSVSVGETHLLIVSSLYHPIYDPNFVKEIQKQKSNFSGELEETDEGLMFNEAEPSNVSSTLQIENAEVMHVPSLKSLCEKVAAEVLVEPRSSIQLLEIADSLGADNLRNHCQDIVLHNLDYIFTVSTHAVAGASPDILANLEKSLDIRSSESWSHRRLPTPTATYPAILNSEEEDNGVEVVRMRDNNHIKNLTLDIDRDQRLDFFLQPKDDPNEGIGKRVRTLWKKLQQIEMLEAKQSVGHVLDDQQVAKLETKLCLESTLAELGVPIVTMHAKPSSSSVFPDGKGTKKSEVSRKQKRKSKQRVAHVETVSSFCVADKDSSTPLKDFLHVENPQVPMSKDEDAALGGPASKESSFFVQEREINEFPKYRGLTSALSKKKNKKGGLSMFLSGALDDTPKDAAPPPPTPRSEGPAWGGTKISKGSTSLRVIQDEQSKTICSQATKCKDDVEDSFSNNKSEGKLQLCSFLPSNPIPVVTSQTSHSYDGEIYTPPWAASGTPPVGSRPSLRDIQMQQKGRQMQCLSHSPKNRTDGFAIANNQGSPSDPAGVNRWFKHEVDIPSSIRSIQIEEKAMKDLKRFYSSVKVVRNPS